jgi:enoyl-CoA hydratase
MQRTRPPPAPPVLNQIGCRMSTPGQISVAAEGDVRVVTMDRPELLNAFDQGMHAAFVEVLRTLGRDESVGAVVLTGAGKAFCAGGDFAYMKASHLSLPARIRSQQDARDLVLEFMRLGPPVVAAVNGAAVGLGATIALSCDLVVMSARSHLRDPHVSIGLTAGDGGAVLWPLHTGLLRAKEYLLLGDRIEPDTALSLGLANRVVEPDDVVPEALRLAHRLAAQPRHAVQATKRALALHAEQAALTSLEFGLAAELADFTDPAHIARVRELMGSAEYDATDAGDHH